jgi:hypothetical protein
MTVQRIEEIRPKSADLRGVGEVRLLSYAEGPARGKQLVQIRTSSGIDVECSVDRSLDISSLRWKGLNLGWNGPNGAGRQVDPESEGGLGLLRGFDGFLVTCGLDHFGLPASGPSEHFIYPHRKVTHYPLHGRISAIAASGVSYGWDLVAEEPIIWCQGVVRQACLFGEVLELRRRIEVSAFGDTVRLIDKVSNVGFRPARHALLYHLNIGYPLLDEQTVLDGSAPEASQAFAAFPPRPAPDHVERVDTLRPDGIDGEVTLAVANPADIRAALRLRYRSAQLPGLALWRAYQSGIFALGIEPHTARSEPGAAYEPGNPAFLEPGAVRSYGLELRLGEGAQQR